MREITSRIAAAPETLQRISEIVRGLAAKNNDDAINFLISYAIKTTGQPNEILAGYALRQQYAEYLESEEGNQRATRGFPVAGSFDVARVLGG